MPIKRNNFTRKESSSTESENMSDFGSFVSQTPKRSGNRVWMVITIIAVVLILAGVVYWLSQGQLSKDNKFKAVFLENGQVYFAKVVKEDSLNLYLDDVYYVQTQQQTIPATEEGGQDQVVDVPAMVKRGNEIHKPQGWLQINRDKIISVEEIGADSEIITEINRLNSAQ